MEKAMTYQLNPLVEAQKGFDVMETRIFYLGLQAINPHITEKDKYYDVNFPDTVITPSELKNIFGHGQYIKELDKATDRLIGRYISIRYEDGFGKYTIFQHIRYKEGKGLFIKFNEDMRPFILDIYKGYKKYGFTRVEMQQIFFLGSAYAMRLLELLLQYKSTAKKGIIEREISIDDLRTKLNVPPEAYKNRINNFKKKVLESPISDINKNTQYYITYEVVKSGRTVTGFRFMCNCNKTIKDDDYTTTVEALPVEERLEQEGQGRLMEYPTPAPATSQELPQKPKSKYRRGLTDTEEADFDRLINREISPKKARMLIDTYNHEIIDRNIKHALASKNDNTTRNLAGLIISFIESDTAGEKQIEDKIRKENEERKQRERRQAYDDFHGTHLAEIGKGKTEEKKKEAPITELTELEANIIIRAGEKAIKPVLAKMKKLGLTLEDVKAGKRK